MLQGARHPPPTEGQCLLYLVLFQNFIASLLFQKFKRWLHQFSKIIKKNIASRINNGEPILIGLTSKTVSNLKSSKLIVFKLFEL
jgi:hypothetical protein